MYNINFITFGNLKYKNAVDRLCNQATQMNIFNYITGYNEHDLQNDNNFWSKHR